MSSEVASVISTDNDYLYWRTVRIISCRLNDEKSRKAKQDFAAVVVVFGSPAWSEVSTRRDFLLLHGGGSPFYLDKIVNYLKR
jgi:hypothetical protein